MQSKRFPIAFKLTLLIGEVSMKKYSVGSLILVASITIISLNYDFSSGEDNTENSTSELNNSLPLYYADSSQTIYEIDDLQSLINLSHVIVKAELKEKNSQDSHETGTVVYHFETKEVLFGEPKSKEIHLYANGYELHEQELKLFEPLFEEGLEYYLFMNVWKNVYYPAPVYTLVDSRGIVKIDDQELTYDKTLLGNLENTKKLEADIDDGLNNRTILFTEQDETYQGEVITKTENLTQLSELSTHIAIIETTELIIENPNLKAYNAKLIEGIKGNFTSGLRVRLPANTETNEHYLVFGRFQDSIFKIATREDSVYQVNTDEFSHVYNELEQLRKK